MMLFSADSGALTDSNRFKRLATPLVLSSGDYTIVAHGYGGGELAGHESFGGPSSEFKTLDDGGGAIPFVGTSRLGTSAGSFPSVVDAGTVNYYSAGTFRFSTAAVGNEIVTDIRSQMQGVNTTAFVRLPFTLNSADNIQSMTLQMYYNDGFVVYVNGQEACYCSPVKWGASPKSAILVAAVLKPRDGTTGHTV